ncbi:MAG: hypothetical protein WC455_21290 [Dehalococcoidia bacterium]|jgi:hypothetical protein
MNWQLIAKLKILKDRAAGWAALFNLVMVAYLFAKDNPHGLLIILIGSIIIIALAAIDYLYILPKEQELIWQKNPEWMKR